jgi:hypothetical protein
MKKTNSEKLAKSLAKLADYNNGSLSRKRDPKNFAALNQRIANLKAAILKEEKIKHGARLASLGFNRTQIQNIFDDLNLNSKEFQILDLI